MKRHLILTLTASLSLSLAGCGDDKNKATEPVSELPSTDLSSKILKFSAASTSNPKIFLVAGGRNDANFAQEIINQKAMWLSQGLEESDIECYYARPFDSDFEKDKAQYQKLAPQLASCRPANSGIVLDALKLASEKSHPYIYLYVTSHGASYDSVQRGDSRFAKANPFLNQFWIALDASASGETLDMYMKASSVQKDKVVPETYFFTPKALQTALQSFSPSTKKFVVLQACHSGGFLDAPTPDLKADTLVSVPNSMVMTAARWDRTSFGCGSGFDQTYFGEVFNETLKRELRLPSQIDWASVYRQANEGVLKKEQEQKIDSNRASLPQFFSNLLP